MLDELTSDPDDKPIKAILYLWASSVAFYNASSIAASSCNLFAFAGFLTASTEPVSPFPVLMSIYYKHYWLIYSIINIYNKKMKSN